MQKLSQYLLGVSNVEGIPVVRTLEDQLKTPLPHLMIYASGQVKIFTTSTQSKEWDPTIPLRKQVK